MAISQIVRAVPPRTSSGAGSYPSAPATPVYSGASLSAPSPSSSSSQSAVIAYMKYGAAQGLKAYNPNDPFASYYPVVSQRNMPLQATSKNNGGFLVICEGMLRARGLIYYKKSPGDCPQQNVFSSAANPSGELSDLKLGASAASGVSSAIGAIGVISGPATLGIGLGISVGAQAIAQIFTHHAQAVQTEQETICAVTSIFNQVIAALDKGVQNGTVDASDAVSIMGNYAQQANAQLETIEKTCNAACYYQGLINAQVDFAGIYYPKISPNISSGNPSNPSTQSSVSASPLGAPTTPNEPGIAISPTVANRNPVPSSTPHAVQSINASTFTPATSNTLLYVMIGIVIAVLFFAVKKG